jgi:hypothetical protein
MQRKVDEPVAYLELTKCVRAISFHALEGTRMIETYMYQIQQQLAALYFLRTPQPPLPLPQTSWLSHHKQHITECAALWYH